MSAIGQGNAEIRRRGLMLILSSPSGAGKTTIARGLLDGDANLVMSVSCTTRAPRPGEADGVDYRFISTEAFHRMVERGAFLEHARVFDHWYGTPRAPVEDALAAGRDVLFDIDWQGTQQLAENARDDVVSIFVLPPSLAELERRLKGRKQDSAAEVAKRMSKAADELSHYREYRYIIVNRSVDDSLAKARAILAAERLHRDRQVGLADFINALRGAESDPGA